MITPNPTAEVIDIHRMLDDYGIPRFYNDSPIECTARERVNILIQLCKVKGIEWIEQEAER